MFFDSLIVCICLLCFVATKGFAVNKFYAIRCVVCVGRSAAASMERAVCPQRRSVFHAAARRSASRRRRTPRQSDGRRPRGRFHGPHPRVPGPGGEAQSAAGRLRRIQLSQGDRSLQLR